MSKFLFIVSKYGDDIQTNGRVLQPIIEQLQLMGNDVYCISESDLEREYVYFGTQVFTVKQRLYNSLIKKKAWAPVGRALERIVLLANYSRYPNVDNKTALKLCNKIGKLHEKEQFDCILAVNRKFTNVQALRYVKKKYPDAHCGVIYFDLVNANRPKYYAYNYFNYLCNRVEKQIYDSVDQVLYPDIAKDYCSKLFGNSSEKVSFFDYPGFRPSERRVMKKSDDRKELTFVYAGTLNQHYRSPEPLFKMLSFMDIPDSKLVLKLFAKGDYSDILDLYRNKGNVTILDEGIVSKSELDQNYYHADFVVNISNRGLNAIPSKVFELIALGKPVLNFIQDKDDPTISYFQKYPMVCNIRCYEDLSEQIPHITQFINEARDLSDEEMRMVSEAFYKNTPEYFCHILNQWLEA